ncbi:hypothetical protein [Caballeronia sp. INDeC2]|uniref:hypothetical protein n=1 Tax=Caballeronia sp. INDeC2 TaxID=2921747 RepID=UPI0020284FFD|nr:hypothetical protein [Caballeronia sp. INDeC2]
MADSAAKRAQSITNAIGGIGVGAKKFERKDAPRKKSSEPRVCTYQVSLSRAAIGVMDPYPDTKPQGAFSALLADQDLTHLELVLRRSLSCDLGGPLLPPSYWRERLASITRRSHLSHTQIQTVHRLYLHIDAFEAAGRQREEELRSEREQAALAKAKSA